MWLTFDTWHTFDTAGSETCENNVHRPIDKSILYNEVLKDDIILKSVTEAGSYNSLCNKIKIEMFVQGRWKCQT